jgi:hypothetical protein
MSKTFEINIKKLQDPKESKQDVKKNETELYSIQNSLDLINMKFPL